MPSIRSVPLVPLSATSQTYTGMRSPPPVLRPPSLVTPLVQPGTMLTRQPTIDQLNQSFGSQQYVQSTSRSTLMSPVLQPVQYNSPFVWPSVPHTTASQSGLRRDMSISSVGSVDLNLSTASYAVPKRTPQVNNPPETVHEDDNESSTSESDSSTDEEEREEKLSRRPSLAVCKRTSSRIDSTSHIEPTGNNIN